jgi:two-component system, sensor histidine kinase and response regulator
VNANKGAILIVDDVPTNLNVLMQFLENTGFDVLVATDGEGAIEQAAYALPDIILLDVMMPVMDGFETCRRLKANPVTQDIPVIFMTALSDTLDKVYGFELGAADYITKPLHQEEVVARVNAHLTMHRQKQELERQKQEIEQLREQDRLHFEKLAYLKDQMLSTASHDLKNPLTTIVTVVALLRRYISADDTRIQKKLDSIESSVDYMRDLIANLLDLARLETGAAVQKQEAKLKQLMQTSISHVTMLADEKHIKLHVRLPENDVTVSCDSFQVGQVLQNLISNALKYTPEGGTVEVSAKLQETMVTFQISDNGFGIPEKDIPRIFEKFYRVNSTEHQGIAGTGLGLAIVREIVQQHGGNVEVKSKLGEGSTFSFSIPR